MAKTTPQEKQEAKARKIARVLVDATFKGEREAAKMWGIVHKTVYNYWDQLESDPLIARFYTIEKERREKEWASKLTGPILGALDYFDRVFIDASTSDPDTIKAVTEAFSVLVEAKAVNEMLHANANATDRAQAATDAEDAAGYQYAVSGAGKRPAATA